MSAPADVQLSPGLRARLLAAAREAISARFEHREPRVEVDPALQERRAVFVTLRRRADDDLRGCVGQIEARHPLAQAVARAAQSAAFDDGRFEPVRAEELPGLSIDISVLGPLVTMRPEQIEAGRHGVVLRFHGVGGVLLPQVATEQGWNRAQFLDALCRKVGLPPGTWQRPDCTLQGFTAEVFGEEETASKEG